MTTPVYAITGASGHVGRYAVHQLLARGVLLGALRHGPAELPARRRPGVRAASPGLLGSSTVPPPKHVQALRNDIMFVRMGRGRPGWPAEERA
jgi:NAD(P)-dependent dehydrogenase (short-subunit alcohol dehydrogenase family)